MLGGKKEYTPWGCIDLVSLSTGKWPSATD